MQIYFDVIYYDIRYVIRYLITSQLILLDFNSSHITSQHIHICCIYKILYTVIHL